MKTTTDIIAAVCTRAARAPAIIAAVALCATTAAARTVSVSSVSSTSASLAFGGADGADYMLAWGYGATDGGSATNAWDTFEVLGSVAADDTSRTVALPAGWGSSVSHARFFLLEPEIPADATRVEYLQSSGSQWIDTDVRGKVGVTAEVDVTCVVMADNTVLGSRIDGGNTRFFVVHWNANDLLGGLGANWYWAGRSIIQAGNRYFIRSVMENGNQSISVNGTVIGTKNQSSTLDTGRSMYLFACHNGSSASYGCSAKLHSAKIWLDGDMKRDFVPCLDPDGAPALYDRVSKRYFHNGGSGSFATGGTLPAALVVASSSFSVSAVRSIAVSALSGGNATLSFGAPNGSAYTLAWGYGTSDGGAATNAWDTFETLGAVAADATTQPVALPAGWGTTVTHLRFFLLEKPLPSGATRLDYIESSGSQWIDTGVRGRIGASTELDVTCVAMADNTILGSRIDSGDTRFFVVHWNANDLLAGLGGHANWYWAQRTIISAGNRYLIRSVMEDGNQSIFLNGSEVGTARTFRTAFDTKRSLYLFACHNGSSASYGCSARLHSGKIWLDGELQRDFVPCRDENDEVCLYDLVSGEYFRNGGSGSFAAGGEVPAAVASSSATVAATIGDDGAADTVVWDEPSVPESMALVKVGSNRAIVQTAAALDADIDVRSGSLVFSGRTCTNEWYRFLFNGTQYNREDPIAIGDLKVFSDTAGIENIALGIGAGDNVLDAGTSPANLAPGQCVAHFATATTVPEGQNAANIVLSDLSAAFDGSAKNAVLSATAQYIYNNQRQTWVAFRMAEGNNRVQSYLPVKSNATWYWHPSAWLFQTSVDGVTWQTVDTQTGAISSSGYGSTPFVIKGFLADGAAGFDPAANVKVASGATLDASGVAGGQSLSHLTVDWAAGAGTITGVTIAQNGVLDLVNVPADAKLGGATIPVTLHQTTGAANFGTWTLRVNGVASDYRLYWNGSALRIPGALVLSVW